ncbi:MAG: hypothetical protein HYU66_16350, partial [Armatimonadetes bacterium]|nr:hypothetical protein [Armatimonadota bacterium]
SADGRLTLGAGFQGAYNTYYRLDRHVVQFYVRSADVAPELTRTALPRADDLAGAYLFDLDGQVLAAVRGVWRLAGDLTTWHGEPAALTGRLRLGGGVLLFDSNSASYEGQPTLTKPAEGSYVRLYYAQGRWFWYHVHQGQGSGYRPYQSDADGYSRLYACRWKPGDGPADIAKATVQTLKVVGEVPFAWGQLGGEVLTCSNIGGLYAFDGRAWRTLREPDLKQSYQVYAMLNHDDRLLMGQYPSGRLFEYDGRDVRELPASPPVMPGVSGSVREAQTCAIYGGRLFVGVWPWGELWCSDDGRAPWRLAARLFDHPDPTDQTNHPYENECKALGIVQNQWGQRVTSLVPWGDSLIASTSAKAPCDWEPRFEFLGGEKWKAYGTIYRLTIPGSLSVPVAWTAGPTELRLSIRGDEMRIEQDGRLLGAAKLPEALLARLRGAEYQPVQWGRGVFGRYGGESLDGTVE